MEKIFYNKQSLDKDDILEVKKSLNQKLITTGPYVSKFENGIKTYLKVKNAISCSSGTSAIYLAFRAINLSKDDTVIIPAINFIASVNAAKVLNAKIYLCDVDYNTGQMTPALLEECIKKNSIKKIKLVVTMYLGGNPNNVLDFYKLKNKYNFYLVEDSCHALGAKYKINNKFHKIGSCRHSDISTFSLHPVKSITSGEGGIITTNNTLLANKIKLLRSHGIERKKKYKKKYWQYDIVDYSLNFRLSDINAALGFSQLKKLNNFILKRNQLARIYDINFRKLNHLIKPLEQSKFVISSFHLYIVLIKFNKLKINKEQLIKLLNKKKYIHNFIIFQFLIILFINI